MRLNMYHWVSKRALELRFTPRYRLRYRATALNAPTSTMHKHIQETNRPNRDVNLSMDRPILLRILTVYTLGGIMVPNQHVLELGCDLVDKSGHTSVYSQGTHLHKLNR